MKFYILTPILVHVYGYCLICFEILSGFDHTVGCLYYITAVSFVLKQNPELLVLILILHIFSHLILNITRIRWSTAFLQLLNFVCLLEFGYFTAFSLPASYFATIFVLAKIYVIIVTFRKLFSRKAKTTFRKNTKTKLFVSTLTFSFLQLNLDWRKNSKTKVEKAFFFIFMSSCAEMSFWGSRKKKKSLNSVQPKIFSSTD
jgi:uncharacterized membrane protein YfcA